MLQATLCSSHLRARYARPNLETAKSKMHISDTSRPESFTQRFAGCVTMCPNATVAPHFVPHRAQAGSADVVVSLVCIR